MAQFKVLHFLICKILHAVGLGPVLVHEWIFLFKEKKQRPTITFTAFLSSQLECEEDVFPLWRAEKGHAAVSKKKRTLLFCSTMKNAEDLCTSLLAKGSASSST